MNYIYGKRVNSEKIRLIDEESHRNLTPTDDGNSLKDSNKRIVFTDLMIELNELKKFLKNEKNNTKTNEEKQRDEVLKKLLQTPPKKNKPIKEKELDKG